MAKTIIPNDGQQDDSAEPADSNERRDLARDAACQLDALARMLEREVIHG
jgi:hypothetical protein